jgi:3-dehydroquinate synthase
LVALGGGVTGDMAGFAAATYMRGIRFVQIPTTFLAQVDSSVGGKTGIDFMGNKNMVGAFYQPELVYINSATLRTLPAREVSAGLAEAVKTGYIADKELLDYFFENRSKIISLDTEAVNTVIYRCCSAKAYVVNKDEKELGLRAILNFGHTFGHAVETLLGFKLLHGECVAVGMVAAMYYSAEKFGIAQSDVDACKELLTYLKLPISCSLGEGEIYEQMFLDKKTSGGHIKIVALNKLGEAVIDKEASESDIKRAIAFILD